MATSKCIIHSIGETKENEFGEQYCILNIEELGNNYFPTICKGETLDKVNDSLPGDVIDVDFNIINTKTKGIMIIINDFQRV